MRRLLVPVLALLLFAACEVDVEVSVEAEASGSGEVTVTARLDADAVAELEEVDGSLRTDDLAAAGWEVGDPVRDPQGGASLTATKAFDTLTEARAVLGSLTGDAPGEAAGRPPLRDLRIAQERSFFRTTSAFTGTVDLTGGLGAFSDAQLQEALGGLPLGVPPERLEEHLGAPAADVFALDLRVELPGSMEANVPVVDGAAVWSPALGERLELEARATSWNTGNLVLLGMCIASTLGLVAVLLVRLLSR